MDRKTIYVSIGNTDNKLTQEQWSKFCSVVDNAVRFYVTEEYLYGAWYSESSSPWQNACWGFSIDRGVGSLKEALTRAARQFDQDAIAWAEVGRTDFL